MLKVPPVLGITEGLETIPAEQALAYLAGRDLSSEYKQRPLEPSRYLPIAEDMRRNKFKPEITREPIQFNSKGQLMNGQHRMKAQTLTGKTYTYWVVRGIPPEMAPYIDQGFRRTNGDVLSVVDIAYPKEAASIVRSLMALRTYRYNITGVLSNLDSSDFAKKHAEHLSWTATQCHIVNMKYCSPTILGPIIFLAGLNMPNRCEEFIAAIHSGTMLQPYDPAYLARERFLDLKAKTSRLTNRNPMETPRPQDVWWWLIPTWNRYATNERMGTLPYKNKKKPFDLTKTVIKGETHDWRTKLWEGLE